MLQLCLLIFFFTFLFDETCVPSMFLFTSLSMFRNSWLSLYEHVVFFRFSVFPFYVFSVSVLRFSVSVNAYAHAYAHALCSSTSSFKNETSTSTSFSSSSFHFTFFCFFFRLLSISWLVVHVVFFRLSFIHIQKKRNKLMSISVHSSH